MDEAIRQSMTQRQFFDNLKKKGYEIKVGKDISLRPPGKERFVRLVRNFGEDYTLEAIRKRLLEQCSPDKPLPEPKPRKRYGRLKGSFRSVRKVTGFRALYFHYCYLLGFFPKKNPKSHKRLHFLLKEDLIKLDNITKETWLLAREKIDTGEQLFAYQSKVEETIKTLTAQRKELYRSMRRVEVIEDAVKLAEVKTQTAAITKQLRVLRKEVKLCEDIAERSGVIRDKIQAIQQTKGKEIKSHEQFR